MILTDQSPMPFGKFKGTAMIKIKPSYFHYLWTHGIQQHSKGSPQEAVFNYIEETIPAFVKENPDLIW
jgi:uncharacterized protein (DUF3820 family)